MPAEESSDNSSLTSFDHAAQVEQVAKWILTGARDRDVLEAIEKTWPQADPMALVQEAIGGFALSATLSRDAVRGFCFEATRDLYRRMTEIGDFAGALRALKQLADLAA